MRHVALATEDALSEAIGQRLVKDSAGQLSVALLLRRDGFGYLKSKIRNFCELARRMPVLLITDLDNEQCPMTLIGTWSRHDVVPDQLMFRVAVRQIESWLLADREGLASFLTVSVQRLPGNPDDLTDAKRFLLQLASRAPRQIRDELVADPDATAAQGLGYNALLSSFVRSRWNPSRAARRSDSLARARSRLTELAMRSGS